MLLARGSVVDQVPLCSRSSSMRYLWTAREINTFAINYHTTQMITRPLSFFPDQLRSVSDPWLVSCSPPIIRPSVCFHINNTILSKSSWMVAEPLLVGNWVFATATDPTKCLHNPDVTASALICLLGLMHLPDPVRTCDVAADQGSRSAVVSCCLITQILMHLLWPSIRLVRAQPILSLLVSQTASWLV